MKWVRMRTEPIARLDIWRSHLERFRVKGVEGHNLHMDKVVFADGNVTVLHGTLLRYKCDSIHSIFLAKKGGETLMRIVASCHLNAQSETH